MLYWVYLWPLYLKVSLAGYKICGLNFLPLTNLKMLLHGLLVQSFTMGKCDVRFSFLYKCPSTQSIFFPFFQKFSSSTKLCLVSHSVLTFPGNASVSFQYVVSSLAANSRKFALNSF